MAGVALVSRTCSPTSDSDGTLQKMNVEIGRYIYDTCDIRGYFNIHGHRVGKKKGERFIFLAE